MDATKIEKSNIEFGGNKKRKALDLHNQRRREKRQGIYNLTKWHVSRLRKMEDDEYKPFIMYIKWMGGIPPNENQDENDYLDDLRNVFDQYNGYNFFREHDLSLPPIGVGGYESTYFD